VKSKFYSQKATVFKLESTILVIWK